MADRYWNPAGAGNWGDTSSWAASDGGGTGETVPSASDNVVFTSTNVNNCTVNVSATCLDLNFTGGTGYTGTFAGSSALAISGSLTLGAGMTRTYTGAITFNGVGVHTITTNTITVGGNCIFSGTGQWTFQDAWDSGLKSISHTNGTLVTNNQTITSEAWTTSGTNARAITLGSSVLNINGWTYSGSNLTLTEGTAVLNVGQTATFVGNGETYYEVNLTSTQSSGWGAFSGNNTFTNLSVTSNTTKAQALTLSDNQTITGTLTINGNSVTNRVLIKSSVLGTARTLTAAIVTVTNADFQDITGAGAGSWNLSAITGGSGDCGGNTGITFTTADTNYWIGDTGSWSDATQWSTSTGGAADGRVPLPQDTAIFDANSFSTTSLTVTQDMPRIPTTNWTGATNTPTWTTSTQATVYGSITLISGMILTASTQTYSFEGRGVHTITSATLTWAKQISLSAHGGSLALQDALVTTRALSCSSGHFNANNQNITALSFSGSGTGTRQITMGSGTWTLTTGTTNPWTLTTTTNLTFDAGTSTIKLAGTLTAARTFAGGGLTYNNFWNATTGAFAINMTGSNTFNDFKIDAARTQRLTAGTTTTVTTFTATGTSGNEITIGSITAASHTLAKAGGGTITGDYLLISYSTATPGSTWYATNSTDNGNNSGWNFGVVPTIASFSGVAVANIASVDGVAVANIASINSISN